MKPLKQQPAVGSSEVGQAREGMLIAGQVFSNYVLLPASGHPDKGKPAARLHGAGLLVFGDELAQQVQLRTGYAAHVAGNPTLRPSEDGEDEIVSSHINSSQFTVNSSQKEETLMTREIHCSACGATVQPGNQFCGGCGLQLTAQAVPTLEVEGPRFSFWAVVIAAIGVLWILCYALDAIKK